MTRAEPLSGPEMDGLADIGLKFSAEASTDVVLTAGLASNSGRAEIVTGASSPAVARSRGVLVIGWLSSFSMVVASFAGVAAGIGSG